MNNLQSVFVQRKTANGTIVFPVDGVECSNVSTDNHFTPIGAYMPSTGETYVFWSESNSTQTLAGGLLGQKISAAGARLWNDAGVYFKPMDNNTFSSLYVIVRDTNVYVSWDEAIYGSANSNIRALKTGRSGTIGWTGSIVNVSTASSNKIRMNYIMNPAGMGIMTWEDMRIDGGIYAQNLNLNGTLGNPVNINPNGSSIPAEYILCQNFPNPFNPVTKINFDLKEQGFVTLKVYDMLGRVVSRLINGNEPAGKYSIDFNAENFSSGVYFYSITVNGFSDIKKMIILK
ncbi:MAG TPA: T9SS type A sorting domain-containing protein [Ignavibacteria bacterium]|nr:T9SS type A sorting domain-containing protein [Ignavibacteria bacterium]